MSVVARLQRKQRSVGRSKRTFGVKAKTTGAGKVPKVSGKQSPRAFGVKVPYARGIPGVSGKMESCPEGCPGEYIEGMWIHSKECRWSAVLWRAHGKTEEDWSCPYDCPPQEISSGWTHQWECAFWERTGRTPFDHNAPRGTEKVDATKGRSEHRRNKSVSGLVKGNNRDISWRKKRTQQRKEGKLWKEVVPLLFSEEEDDDLPF